MALKNKIISFFKEKKLHLDRHIISYLICVAIASVLWFLNALNKDYTTELSYPIKYTNLPMGKYPVSELPEKMTIETKAQGFVLLGYKIRTSFLPITINVASYINPKQQDNILEYTLHTNDNKDKIGNQLRSDIKIQYIYPETIHFKFENSKTRKIATLPIADYTLKRQFSIKNIYTIPDSIEVSGPESIIDTLNNITTVPVKLKELKNNVKKIVKLTKEPNCTYEENSVELNIEIEQLTEASRVVPVTVQNVPDSLQVRLFPGNVTVQYEVGLSNYEKINNKDFLFVVDYRKTKNSSYLEIEMKKAPSFIKNISFTPQRVEYILERK